MDKLTSHYPDFQVMKEKEHWDPHTREIVEKRLTPGKWKALSDTEITALSMLCSILLADDRPDVLNYVIHHFDNSITADIGEAQRKKDVPKESILIREGLRALDAYCTSAYGALFSGLKAEDQHHILDELMRGNIDLQADGIQLPAKEFFTKIQSKAVSAYYSHPNIWSEIGYAGPAYPRGYVRSEWGLADPWEAKRKDAK